MKRRLLLTPLAALLALASIVAAQTPSQATLRTPAGDKPLPIVTQNGLPYFPVDDVLAALGGTVKPEGSGFTAQMGGVTAALGPDSRFAVVHEDLIEMPSAPVVVDGKPYAPVAFFAGFLGRAADLDAVWDATGRALTLRPQTHGSVGAQVSVANVQGTTKVVVTLTAPTEYAILKSSTSYVVRFKTVLRAPAGEQTFDDPNVSKAAFVGNDLRIQLTGADVVGDAYKLENPFRVVIDLRKGTPAPQTTAAAPPTRSSEQPPGIHTIVIDPGHGGKDLGASGPGGTAEKDATLAVCRRLASALESKTGARVVLTRDDDTLVALDQRTAIANQYKADLFLSVHMNAAGTKGARGSETYFLSADASDELARKAAEIENAAAHAQAQALSASSDLKLILWDLAQQEYLQESSRFATDIQEEMNAVAGIQNRGVKQAPFKVLVGATMPAALVEVAFISNPEEEAKLKDEKFVGTVIDAIVRAVSKYKTDYETRIGVIKPAAPVAPAAGTAAAPGQPPPASAAPSATPAPPAAATQPSTRTAP